MIFALALLTVVVHPGNTLYGIGAAHGETLAYIEEANPQIPDFNLIYPGQRVNLRVRLGARARPAGDGDYDADDSGVSSSRTDPPAAAGPSSIQAPPGSFQACVIARESGGNAQVMNSTGHYGLYQFSYSTWTAAGGSPALFGHASPAYQTWVFWRAYAKWGTSSWSPYDGC